MRQFIRGTDLAYAELQAHAKAACIVFPDEELPPGCTQPRARIAFELEPTNQIATLLVDRGVRYEGSNPEVRDWLAAGERHFASFARLQDWIVHGLGPCYELEQATPPS